MNDTINKARQELESLRDELLSGTSYIQAYLLKIEHKTRNMSAALKHCQEVIKNCDKSDKQGNKTT